MYNIVQNENIRFLLSFLANWKLYPIPMTVNLLKGFPPTHTHSSDKVYFKSGGEDLRTIPRKCSPLTQIRREQKKPGPLLLVYFMCPANERNAGDLEIGHESNR